MPYSGGVFTRAFNWVTDRINGIKITATRMDAEMDGMADALSMCVLKDGTQVITNDIPMASHKFTGLSDGTTTGESVHFGQVASETAVGLIELATAAEVKAGTDTTRAVTPANIPVVLLSEGAVSAASEGIIALPTSGYQWVDIRIDGIIPSVNGTQLQARVSTDGGSTYLSTFDYWYALAGKVASSADWGSIGNLAAQAVILPALGNTAHGYCIMRVPVPHTTQVKSILTEAGQYGSSVSDFANLQGTWGHSTAIDYTHIRLYPASGNITFNYRVFGWR